MIGEALPNLTVRVPAPEKPQPEIVTDVPPVTKPAAGEMVSMPNPVQSGAALEELPRSPTATTQDRERAGQGPCSRRSPLLGRGPHRLAPAL